MRFISVIYLMVGFLSGACFGQVSSNDLELALKSVDVLNPSTDAKGFFERGEPVLYEVNEFAPKLYGLSPYDVTILKFFPSIEKREFVKGDLLSTTSNKSNYLRQIAILYITRFNATTLMNQLENVGVPQLEILGSVKSDREFEFEGEPDEFINTIIELLPGDQKITLNFSRSSMDSDESYQCRYDKGVSLKLMVEDFAILKELTVSFEGRDRVIIR